MKWINDLKSSGQKQFKVQSGIDRKPNVTNQQLEEIKGWVLLNANITTKEYVHNTQFKTRTHAQLGIFDQLSPN